MIVLVITVLGFVFLGFRLKGMQGLVNDRLAEALEEIRTLKKELAIKTVALDVADKVDFALNRIEDAAIAARVHGEVVAQDLAASHARADAAEGPHGAAADAASQSGPIGKEKD
jgi:hypothetical protein